MSEVGIMGAVDSLKQIHEIGEYNVVLSAILLVILITCVILGIQKIKDALGLKTKSEIRKKEIDERFENIEKRISKYESRLNENADHFYNKQKEYHEQSIEIRNDLRSKQDSLSNDVHSLTTMIEEYIQKDKERTVVTLRASLWRLHQEFTKQGFVTPDSLKTFLEMGKVYEQSGGNDIFHDKLLPEVEALDIHYPDGSIYTKNI